MVRFDILRSFTQSTPIAAHGRNLSLTANWRRLRSSGSFVLLGRPLPGRRCLLQTTMTMLEEPQNGFGSNVALFHETRNPLRACRQFPLSKLLKTLSLGNWWRLTLYAKNRLVLTIQFKKLLSTSRLSFSVS
jgi:hypothetical protein